MTDGALTVSRSRRLLSWVFAWIVLLGALSSSARAAGILPPANPAADCDRSAQLNSAWNAGSIDACRALEGIGPLVLPSNWSALNPAEQGFVLINLERVNRGLAPIIGLSASLDALAAQGADNQTDPPFPDSGEGGGIWADGSTVFGADMMWLYDDGPNGLDANIDCTTNSSYCWGHRDIILGADGGGTLVAGGGFLGSNGVGSYAYLLMSHLATTGLAFTWSGELPYFPTAPQTETLGSAAQTQTTGAKTTAGAGNAAGAKQVAALPLKVKRRRRHPKRPVITIKFS